MSIKKPRCVKEVLSAYDHLLKLDPNDLGNIGTTTPIPYFPQSVLVSLCNEAILSLAQTNESLISLRAPMYVVGDIHGNIFDLIRILLHANPPPFSRFLFLGDYVDRGDYSIEVITLLLALYLAYPGYIILLRGNHEFSSVNTVYGFKDQVIHLYDSVDLYDQFNDVFSYLPIAATINNEIFCVHGGLSPNLRSLADFDTFPRPLTNYDMAVISDLVWSDPSEKVSDYSQSQRGTGLLFGPNAINTFFNTTKMKKIIRAHQCVQLGVQKFHNDLLYTVFSCSNYVEASNNRCGLLFISPNLEIQPFSMPPGSYIERLKAHVATYEYKESSGVMGSGGRRSKGGTMSISLSMQELQVKEKLRPSRNASQRSSLIIGVMGGVNKSGSQNLPPLLSGGVGSYA